jgi:hypothetical protein
MEEDREVQHGIEKAGQAKASRASSEPARG